MRVIVFLLIAALIAVLVYLRSCGPDAGTGEGTLVAPAPDAAIAVVIDAGPLRCAVRVTSEGLVLDGAPADREAVIERCKATTGADVIVTGDARQGDWDALREALGAAGVEIYTRQH